MNIEHIPNQGNPLEMKLREVKKLIQRLDSIKTNQERLIMEDRIEKLYMENDSELLNYENEK